MLLTLVAAGCSSAFLGTPDGAIHPSDPLDTADSGNSSSNDELSIRGVVSGSDGLPLAGVTVRSPSGATTTGGTGEFLATVPHTGGTLDFEKGGHYAVSRTIVGGNKSAVRVGVLPMALPTAVNVAISTTITSPDGSTLDIPAFSLGTSGLAAVKFDSFNLATSGTHAVTQNRGALGELPMIYAEFVVTLLGPNGALVATEALTAALVVHADTLGGSLPLLQDQGSGWFEVGQATVQRDGSIGIATVNLTSGGVYALGYLVDGCATGQVLDASGSPVAGATVRALHRPNAAGETAWSDDATTAEDGRYTLIGPTLGFDVFAQSESDGVVTIGYATTQGGGTASDPTSCTEIGNLVLTAAGCATANVYAANGSRLANTPFRWQEGDIVYTSAEGEIELWARPGLTHVLVGPGGVSQSFTTSAGTTPEAGNCSRLGNLQLTAGCVQASVLSASGVAVEGAWVAGAGGLSVTDADGLTCLSAQEGTGQFTATMRAGAQTLETTIAATVEAGGGTCHSGECTDGLSLSFGQSGCVSGVVYESDGTAAAGVKVYSSSFDSVSTELDGSFSLRTGGGGTAAVWAEARELVTFSETTDGTCSVVNLYSNAGNHPTAVVADDARLFRVDPDGTVVELLTTSTGWPGSVTDLQASVDLNLILAIHFGTTAYSSSIEGSDFGIFAANVWSAARIAPAGTSVAMQGYTGANAAVALYSPSGSLVRQLSTSAGTESEGLSWSPDGVWIASTRSDNGIEVTPSSAARSPTKIADDTCAFPVWWDTDTVALDCGGAVMLADMDGSRVLSWFDQPGVDDRVWAVSGTRVAYTSGESLHLSYIDLSDDVTVYTGSPGTTFDDVRFDGTGLWLLARVTDPVAGTDVLAVADVVPHAPVWLTESPDVVESAATWAE